MDAVETAIRNALERGDAYDPAYREKVYSSAFAVLERSIEARPDLPADAAERRRDHLKAKIRNIESEFAPAQAPVAEPERGPAEPPPRDDVPAPPEPQPLQPQPTFSPLREAASTPAPQPQPPRREPTFTQPPLRPSAAAPERDLGPLLTEEDLLLDDEIVASEPAPATGPEFEPIGERRDRAPVAERGDFARRAPRRRWIFPFLIGLAVVLAAIAAVWWLIFGSDMLGVSQLDPEPVVTAPADTAGPGAAGEDENWIIVFTPSDPTRAIATDGAKAEVVTHGEDTFLRISSPGPDQPVNFQVGEGILEKLAGHEAVFDIIARAENGQKTQIAVSCDLGSLGDCGRSRFEVGSTISDFLVRTQLGNGPPSGGGTISIVPDVTGSGKALEILRIRASVAGES